MSSFPEPNVGTGGETSVKESGSISMNEITALLDQIGDKNSEAYRLYEESRERWDDLVKPVVEAIAESERLSESDFAIRINTRE